MRWRAWKRTAPLTLAGVLVLVAGVLPVAGPFRAEPPPRNVALLDAEATSKVAGAVGDALTRVFSYRGDDTPATERAAGELLTGRAAQQYRRLFARVRAEAPRQRLSVTARVVRVGVTSLTGDTARVLVFLDQVSTRGGRPSGAVAAAQLSVTARLLDGRWRISEIRLS